METHVDPGGPFLGLQTFQMDQYFLAEQFVLIEWLGRVAQ